MSKNIEQVYVVNPVTAAAPDDLVYIGQKSGSTYIDAAINISDLTSSLPGVMTVEEVSTGYVLMEANTIYLVPPNTEGKVYFQTPPTAARGDRYAIYGAGGNPISSWNLSTQIGQSLINGPDITNLSFDRYAILEPSSPTDRISIICTTANQDFSVEFSSSAGLSLYEQLEVDSTLYSQTSAVRTALYCMAQVDTTYTGYLVKVQRASDSAMAYVLPDLARRPSPLSELDIGGNLAAWMYGTSVNIIEVMDQSGNGYDGIGGGLWIDVSGNAVQMSTTKNTAIQFAGVQSFEGTLPSNYTSVLLNVFALSEITTDSDSSIATLYNPANGDDYGSPLNVIPFQLPPGSNMATYRNGTLSVKTKPALDTRVILTSRFDATNNTLTINGSAGTTVASSGVFGFNKILASARYVSGQPSNHGYFKTACLFVYEGMGTVDVAAVQAWIDANL